MDNQASQSFWTHWSESKLRAKWAISLGSRATVTSEACVFTIAVEVKVLSPPLLLPDEVRAVVV
jgi:hypothetical protein